MKPVVFVTLFFKAVGILLLLRGAAYMGYFLLNYSIVEQAPVGQPPSPAIVSEILKSLYLALDSSAAGGLLCVASPWLAKVTVWGVKE